MALEQLWLMSEIENFYPLGAYMKSGLEKWLIKNGHRINPVDILLWAPRDSPVRIYYNLILHLEKRKHHYLLRFMLSMLS